MGMKVTGRAANLEGYVRRIRHDATVDVEEAILQAAKGADYMRDVMESPSVERPSSKGPGRRKSGLMQDNVVGRVRGSAGSGEIVYEWGWFQRKEPYFYYQDKGFNANGTPVPGMRALTISLMKVREDIRGRMGKKFHRK